MMSIDDLKTWLGSDDTGLVTALVADIRRHVSALRSSGETFYGYAALPGDYCTQPNPATFMVAFNRESDIASEHADDPYYRYSVDEWNNYTDTGFEASIAQLQSSLEQFNAAHSSEPDSYVLDEFEVAFVARTNRAILTAMLELKSNGTFDDSTYLIIWYPDSGYDTMSESAKALNKPEIYEQFASEFE